MPCQATNAKGGPCKARPVSNSKFCYSHAPEYSEERRAAQSRGGRARAVTPSQNPPFEFDFASPEKIPVALGLVATLMLQKRIDAKTTHAVCHAADTSLRAYSVSTLKNEIERLRRQLESARTRPVDPAETKDFMLFEESEIRKMEGDLEEIRRRQEEARP